MIDTILIGLVAGLLTGLFSVGAGAVIVPSLVLLSGLSQLDAEATSLLALVPVALVGGWRQDRYGNVRRADAAVIGGLSAGGALAGVALAHVVPTRLLETAFACVLAVVALQLALRALRPVQADRERATTSSSLTGSSAASKSSREISSVGCASTPARTSHRGRGSDA